MSAPLTGGCLCGHIRYEIDQAVTDVITCHCTDCRKVAGAGLSHNAVVETAKVRFLTERPKVYEKVVDSGRVLKRFFCPECGSSLFSQREKMPERMVLKVGSLDDPSALKVVMNIWMKSALPWIHIEDDVPRHEGNRPV